MTKIEVIEIHSGVPVPSAYKKYPFGSMEVGDVFYVDVDKWSSVRSIATRMSRNSKHQYEVHKVDTSDGPRVGVWRVEDKEGA